MVNRGLAPGTVHTRMNNVRAVLRGAVADRLIPSDPSVGVALPRRRRAQAAMTLPTAAQVGAVLDGRRRPASGRSSRSARSPGSGSARPPASGWRTSTSCVAPSPSPARCSGPAAARSRSGRPSTAASGSCSCARTGRDAGRARRRARPGGRALDVHRRRRPAAAPEHRRPPLAHRDRGRRALRAAAARPPALLRLGADRLRLRRRHRPAGPRARLGDHDAVDLLAPVADRRGPHAGRRGGLLSAALEILWTGC